MRARRPLVATRIGPAVAVAFLLATPFVSRAQEDEDVRRHGIFIDTLDVSLVNIELVALAKGEPVTDLTREDFEVFDDGEPVEITNFFRVEGGQRIVPDEALGTAEEVEILPPGERERAFVVVLVDQRFLAPTSRAKIFHELRERLDGLMADGAQVLVASKLRDVKLVQRPTTDRLEVEAALSKVEKFVSNDYSTAVRRAIRDVEQGLNLANNNPFEDLSAVEGDAQHTFGQAQKHSQEVYQEVRNSVRALRNFIGSLAGLPGRKAVLYVCDRLPIRPGELVWNVWIEKYGLNFGPRFGVHSLESVLREYDTTEVLQDLIADATASRVAFYPVGSGPVSGLKAMSAENRSTAMTRGSLSLVADIESGLRMLADGTGGQSSTDLLDPGWLFDRLHRDLTEYYSLAYPSPHRGDSKSHKIEVRVKRPGVKLHYIERYRDKSSDQEMSEETLAALILDSPKNPLGVEVFPGEAEAKKGGHFLMPVEVRFPISNLVLLPQEEAHVGRVSIIFLVRDSAGRLSDPIKVEVPIEIPHDAILQALSQNAVYAAKLAMRGGLQTVAVGVRDELSATSSTVNIDIRVERGRG